MRRRFEIYNNRTAPDFFLPRALSVAVRTPSR
jgi:hypothetical protein